MSTKFRPLRDQILIQRDEAAEQTQGGLYIPPTAQEEQDQGTVVATGPGAPLESGGVREPSVKKGDTVLFGKYAGTEIKIDGESFLIVREADILGVVEGE